MRPVLAKVCKFESLLDGTLDIEHIALMNDALDIEAENDRRIMDALNGK